MFVFVTICDILLTIVLLVQDMNLLLFYNSMIYNDIYIVFNVKLFYEMVHVSERTIVLLLCIVLLLSFVGACDVAEYCDIFSICA